MRCTSLEDSTILFVGYQAVGTPGRALLEGTQEIKLFGEPVHVAAKICRMPGISGHADVNGLVDWIKAFEVKPQKVFVTHGEDTVTEQAAKELNTSADTIRSAMEQNTLPFPLGFYVSHDNRSAFFIYRGLLEQFKMKVRGENNY